METGERRKQGNLESKSSAIWENERRDEQSDSTQPQ